MNGSEPIVMEVEEKEGQKKNQLRCRTVKLVERNDKGEDVCVEYTWSESKNRYTAPKPESKIPHTPVIIKGETVELTPARNNNKRKRGGLSGLRKNIGSSI